MESYHALERLYKEGKVRAIGVSNFDNDRMSKLLEESEIVPAVNQMEFNPTQQEKEILNFDSSHGIQLEAWSPLGAGKALKNPVMMNWQRSIAEQLPKLFYVGNGKETSSRL